MLPFFFTGLLFISSCETSHKSLILGEIRQLSDLATTEVAIKKFVLGKKEKRILVFKLNDASIVAETYGYLKFGIDLSKITEEDVVVSGNSLIITIPEIKLISFSYPPEEFKLVEEFSQYNRFWNEISAHDIDIFLQKAQTQIGESIPHMGITRLVVQNTENVLRAYIGGYGYDDVTIKLTRDEIDIEKYF